MKAGITESGSLYLKPESETEGYGLKKWEQDNKEMASEIVCLPYEEKQE